jgi:hypothetical protein
MSNHFERLVDVDATPEEAGAIAQRVLDRFRELGLITGEANPDCVLGGSGYQPGPLIADSYPLDEHETPFWKMRTCGVEAEVGRSFNGWALNIAKGLTCPACGAEINYGLDRSFLKTIHDGMQEWLDKPDPALILCPKCMTRRPITEWQCDPPLGFGNVAFTFWNWPPLELAKWKIDIAATVRAITGHTIVQTYGRI